MKSPTLKGQIAQTTINHGFGLFHNQMNIVILYCLWTLYIISVQTNQTLNIYVCTLSINDDISYATNKKGPALPLTSRCTSPSSDYVMFGEYCIIPPILTYNSKLQS